MMEHPPATIMWFRRDLRIHDHPALSGASDGPGRIVPLFVFDPRLLRGRFASPTRTWFMLESVRELRAALDRLGAPLVIRVGDPATVVPALAAETGATLVHVSHDGSPFAVERDHRVEAALGSIPTAARLQRHPQSTVVHEADAVVRLDGRPFQVYGPFRRAWLALPRRSILPPPSAFDGRAHAIETGRLPTLGDLGLTGPSADRALLPEPGETAARRRLDRWLERGVARYDETRDRPDLEDGTSHLSADLHLGLLSPMEVVERAVGAGAGRRRFLDELIWREFYANVLGHRPELRRSAFRQSYDAIEWSTDPAALEAWQTGRTGYPIVDAGMRQLLASGWMHNRARMIVASFLTKDLLIDWRAGEAHFMRHLVDGDVASNNGGWQWVASTGTDPQPYFRIFNPVSQGRRHDPDGTYVRRWVPELADVPAAWIHAPWRMPVEVATAAGVRIGTDYPAPIVEHADARARALAAYDAARRTS
jgi:deoxyribodipyrimidine photo-lyase